MRRMVGAILLALVSSACSFGRTVVPGAFGRDTSFAIVNVNTSERILFTETTLVRTAGGGVDTGGRAVDSGPAAGIFPQTKAAAVRALSRSRRFRLLPEDEVLAMPAYAAAPAHPGTISGARFLPARGYKLVFDKPLAGRLARAAGATGALVVNLQHAYVSAGGGHVAGDVTVMVTAIDRAGQIIWTDFTHERSHRTLASAQEKVPPSALEPLLVDSTERGVRAMVARLEASLRDGRL